MNDAGYRSCYLWAGFLALFGGALMACVYAAYASDQLTVGCSVSLWQGTACGVMGQTCVAGLLSRESKGGWREGNCLSCASNIRNINEYYRPRVYGRPGHFGGNSGICASAIAAGVIDANLGAP